MYLLAVFQGNSAELLAFYLTALLRRLRLHKQMTRNGKTPHQQACEDMPFRSRKSRLVFLTEGFLEPET